MIASRKLHFCRTVREMYKIVTIILPLHSRAIEFNKRRLSYTYRS